MPLSEQLSEETKKDPDNYRESEEVKETVAAEAIEKNKNRTFTPSEMWNRHRQMQSASTRMRKWNLN
jgi:hypothetical protein